MNTAFHTLVVRSLFAALLPAHLTAGALKQNQYLSLRMWRLSMFGKCGHERVVSVQALASVSYAESQEG